MAIVREAQTPRLLAVLRRRLAAAGLRQADVAARLGVSVATAKRWLRGEGLTTAGLEELCRLVELDLLELADAARDMSAASTDRFTPTQERALAAEPRLFFLFFALLNGAGLTDVARDLDLPEAELARHLAALERLGLIDRTPSGRVRLLVRRDVAWRRGGPVARYFEARKSFVDAADPDEALSVSDFFRLTEEGRARVRALMDDVRREIHRIAALPARPGEPHVWHGALFFVRPLNMDVVRRGEGGPPPPQS